MHYRFAFLLLAGTAPAALLAQAPADPQAAQPDVQEPADPLDEDFSEDEEIVVTGRRPRGAVLGDIEPELQLGRRDIRATGAGTIAELLEAIAPQTRSGRGRGEGGPVLLLNGRRISGFSEIRDIPPEAIIRVDILPEEVALKYGYRADQRVVNFVLRPRFRAYTAEVEAGLATAGGRSSQEADVNYLRLWNDGRLNLSAEYQRADRLLESERGVVQAEPEPGIELGRFRSLLPETDQLSVNGTVNRTILGDVSATLNGRFDISSSEALLGLPRPSLTPPALERETDSRTAHLGLSLNGLVQPWNWSLTANYDRTTGDTRTETSLGTDTAETLSEAANAEAVANGPVFAMPAGDVRASVRAGFDARSLESESVRAGLVTERDLSRQRGSAQVNLDVPIASRRRAVLKGLGDLSLSFNGEVEHFSDFGTLRTLGGGLNWSPIEPVSLIASFTDEDGAPSMQQLGDPVLRTPGVRVFDFVRGETVEALRIEGGNPDLLADNRRVWKLGATVRPLGETDLTLTANYTASRLTNPISSFPAATAEIEAAFPERFVRDAGGRLVSIDTRPVNFARARREELRWGVNFSKPFGPQPQPRQGGFRRFGGGQGGQGGQGGRPAQGTQAPQGEPAAGGQPVPAGEARQGRPGGGPGGGGRFGGGRGGGGFGGFGGGGRGGRMNFALYHTWRFTDEVLIRPGVPELDFLDGSAAGSRGGRPRHELEFQAGLFKNGLGGRLTANWQSSTFVRGGPVTGGGSGNDLFFSDFATVNLRLFADLGLQRSLAREHPFLRGMRVSLSINNLLDERQDVRDGAGTRPLSYQPAYLDPLGRSVRISLRKLFF